ncbi:ABC transporter ATP-binding protein [Sinorhizobium alkalisoli]|uniref:ABC transporter ATP-binding protein n=1 Tax=Sinorhizobium alkalisoli TaxID=1752398 RepID=A0A1E3VHR4_9HYPH|nr:ABC transporter ATP-binding protein [Sinorhizobium alkalisoli]MCG5478656.1 ABC transporter ATP-binding protein [Sinorhizobium alkalisoli]ODR93113.1 ABC transporter ATP-binding protein [Sinorhizobium alkalisoli]QFI70570.1 Branched-chain amino acid transport ATP-binding protein LivF [Sinorhizobium alkalisoli]
MLKVQGLSAGYGAADVLHGVDFSVEQGTIVALLGSNGAGKTTILRALSGLMPARGTIDFRGQDLGKCNAGQRVAIGLAHIPQGRGTFGEFTVEDNLAAGAYTIGDRRQIAQDMERWYTAFPRLAERRRQQAGSLSGGEQQMLALARALMSRPKLLMCDEPSLGLAPAITQEIFEIFKTLNREHGMTLLVVEQNADLTLQFAHRAYVLESGAITVSGTARDLLGNEAVQQSYLGV